MTTFTKALNLASGGWALYLVGLAVVLATDHGEVGYVAVGAVIAVAVLTWTRRTSSRTSFGVSLVLGVLLALQSAAYLAADIAGSPVDARVLTLDLVSLVAGLAIVVGSGWALRSRPGASVAAA